MSAIKEAQGIVNEVDIRLGITLTSYQTNEIEWLKDRLEAFLELEIETDELSDPDILDEEDDLDLEEMDS